MVFVAEGTALHTATPNSYVMSANYTANKRASCQLHIRYSMNENTKLYVYRIEELNNVLLSTLNHTETER